LLVIVAWHLATSRPGFLEAVADGVLRFIPLGLFEAGLSAFGPLAKGLLFAGVAAAVVPLGGLFGVLLLWRTSSWSRARLAVVAASVATLVAGALVLPLFGYPPFAIGSTYHPVDIDPPLILGAGAYGVMLASLRRFPAVDSRASEGPSRTVVIADSTIGSSLGTQMSRRRFVVSSAAVLGLGSLFVSSLGVLFQVIQAAAHTVARPTPASGDEAAFGPTPAITPLTDFYVVAKDLVAPSVDAAAWTLAIDGLVDRPIQITLDQLRSMPSYEAYRTLSCISNDVPRGDHYIGNQLWRGVRVSDLLALAGVGPTAQFVHWEAEDGYTESLPIDVAGHADTWIAYEMGGAALRREHGFPARVLIAGRFGMKQPKWVRRMTLAASDAAGYWEERGWDETATVRTMSRIDTPESGTTVAVGVPVQAAGIAYAGDRGISSVQLSPDGGSTWIEAELESASQSPLGPLTWVRWRVPLSFPVAGVHQVAVRATDGIGMQQPEEVTAPLPSGATGWHTVLVQAT
jgi:DMSO/TMAO reductase YedYZ molybdopterin-dependent catalytic subunit